MQPEIVTLAVLVDETFDEMMALCNVNGAVVHVDGKVAAAGDEDVFTRIEICRKHCAENGLGADYVDQFIR